MNLTKILSLFIIGLFAVSCINVVSASIPDDNQHNSDNLLNLVIKSSVGNDVIIENCHFDGSVSNREDNDVNDKLHDIGKYMPKDISKLGNMYEFCNGVLLQNHLERK